MGLQAVLADPEEYDPQAVQLRLVIAEPAGFLGAAGGVVLRVEIDDDRFPGIVRQAMGFSVASRQGEGRGGFSFQ